MCLVSLATALQHGTDVPLDIHANPNFASEPPDVPWLEGSTFGAAAAVDFDFFLLAQFNPPAYVPVAAQSRAKHAITRHEAFPGFWTHGLWPVR
jgi:hypothetical protein